LLIDGIVAHRKDQQGSGKTERGDGDFALVTQQIRENG